MKINKLKIDSFGKLKDTEITLDDGITVIQGKNEAGKSTVGAFIKYMLYGMPKSRRSLGENEKKLYTPWDGNTVSGEMDFTLSDGKKLTALRKNAARAQSAIIDSSANAPFSSDCAGELFYGLDETAYKKTAYTGQADVIFSDSGELDDAIRNMAGSADENIDAAAAIEKLTKAKKELLGIRGNTGKIYSVDAELTELTLKKEKCGEGHKKLLSAEFNLNETKKKIESNKQKLEVLEKESFNLQCLDAKEKLNRLSILEKDFNDARNALTETRRSASNGAFLPDKDFVSELEGTYRAYSELAEKSAELEKNMNGAKQRYSDAYSDENQKKVSAVLSELGISANEAAEKIDELRKKSKSYLIAAIILTVLVITIPIAVVFWVKRSKTIKQLRGFTSKFGFSDTDALYGVLRENNMYSNANSAYKKLYSDAVSAYEECVRKFTDVKDKLISALEKAGAPYDENTLSRDAEKALGVLHEYISRCDALEKDAYAKKANYTAFAQTADKAELEKLGSQYDENISVRDANTVNRDIRFYTQANEGLREKLHEYEKDAAVLSQTLPKPSELESRILSLKEQKSYLAERYAQISLALECLENADSEMKSSVAPQISQRAGEIFGNITDGKYRGLYPDGDMNLSFLQNGDAQVRPIDYLSMGTKELAYISFRLSLCEKLYSERPTLVFDDAFAHFDDVRLHGILDFLLSISDRYQIVIMSCHGREGEYLKNKAKVIDFCVQ